MHRIDGPGATQDNRFTDGDPTAGIPPTIVTDDWANAVQEELSGVIEGAGLTLDKAKHDQLKAAIAKMITDRAAPLATTEQAGLVKPDGVTISITADGRLSARASSILRGVVVAFSGTFGGTGGRHPVDSLTAEPDTGWALCDGENGTPDLRDRFIIGAGGRYASGVQGGVETVTPTGTVQPTTLTTAQMPNHAHSVEHWTQEGGGNESLLYFENGSTRRGFTTGATGGSGSHAHPLALTPHTNMPPYYALAYIMKL